MDNRDLLLLRNWCRLRWLRNRFIGDTPVSGDIDLLNLLNWRWLWRRSDWWGRQNAFVSPDRDCLRLLDGCWLSRRRNVRDFLRTLIKMDVSLNSDVLRLRDRWLSWRLRQGSSGLLD